MAPLNDEMHQLRDSYIVTLNSILGNLDLKRSDPLRTKYPQLFQEARGLHSQCTILDHKYDVAGAVDIDWDKVWATVNERLPSQLAPLLEVAIETEKCEIRKPSK